MSSALIESELQSEFGAIPPAFLPVGNQRLFEHQIRRLPNDETIALTIPEGYEMEPYDQNRLDRAGVKVLRLPKELSLGEAVLYSLNLLPHAENETVHILHGDTLFEELPINKDVVLLSEVTDSYDWAKYYGEPERFLGSISDNDDHLKSLVACGFFSFSESRELARALIESRFHFIDAINLYHKRIGLETLIVDSWYDFGHVHTYYRSKSSMTTQRAFNEMTITSTTVTKKSQNSEKMNAEANWFCQLPPKLKCYAPQLLAKIEDGRGYQIEYLHLTALNELFVFGDLPVFVWRRILNSCLGFIDECIEHKKDVVIESSDLCALLGNKTATRLNSYAMAQKVDIDHPWVFNGLSLPSLRQILINIEQFLPTADKGDTWYHGDLCFSNILYDFRTGGIKVIDPRGVTPCGIISPYGDIQYDIAKLSHSLIGRYDVIIAGYFKLEWNNYNVSLELPNSQRMMAIEDTFTSLVEDKYGLNKDSLIAMQIHLFISMLPLHAENRTRQSALMANALRLYTLLGDSR
jgi:hypothetical protein